MDRVGYVILYVRDLAASIAFYRDILGLPFKFKDAGYAEFATHGTRLALYEQRRAEWLTGRTVAPDRPPRSCSWSTTSTRTPAGWQPPGHRSSAVRRTDPGGTVRSTCRTRTPSSSNSRRRSRAAADAELNPAARGSDACWGVAPATAGEQGGDSAHREDLDVIAADSGGPVDERAAERGHRGRGGCRLRW
jgi:catechol 2,3-dioxygenase-like lactoylglutathione lyase family enzyme